MSLPDEDCKCVFSKNVLNHENKEDIQCDKVEIAACKVIFNPKVTVMKPATMHNNRDPNLPIKELYIFA